MTWFNFWENQSKRNHFVDRNFCKFGRVAPRRHFLRRKYGPVFWTAVCLHLTVLYIFGKWFGATLILVFVLDPFDKSCGGIKEIATKLAQFIKYEPRINMLGWPRRRSAETQRRQPCRRNRYRGNLERGRADNPLKNWVDSGLIRDWLDFTFDWIKSVCRCSTFCMAGRLPRNLQNQNTVSHLNIF
jgi:hypothetical protein